MKPSCKTKEIVTVVKVDTPDITIVKLPRGVWFVDGKEFDVQEWAGVEVLVKNVSEIKARQECTKISHYENSQGKVLTVDEWDAENKRLSSKGYPDDYSPYNTLFIELEDEFEYRKFRKEWNAKYTTQVTWLDVELQWSFVKIETGNPFITSLFCTTEFTKDDSLLYIYNRLDAINFIISECFESLNFTFKEDASPASSSKEKVWGRNSLRSTGNVVAFGTYLFDRSFPCHDSVGVIQRGTLDQCQALYEKDKRMYENHIKSRYAMMFDDKEISKVSAGKILNKLERISSSLSNVQAKTGSYSILQNQTKELRELIKDIKGFLADEL